MSLHIVQCRPDPHALASWATRNGLLSPDGDYGYALHALFCAAFGSGAPKPFRYVGDRQELLAYSALGFAELRERAALAIPEVAHALGLDTLAARAFPTTWRVDQRLAFEVRVRPVVRTKDGRERDAFLHAIGTAARSEREGPSAQSSASPSRDGVYSKWLERHLEADGAAEVLRNDLHGFRLTRVLRRPPSSAAGNRQAVAISGPDTLFKGELRVDDRAAFARLVARGVGRHRAFGFGMLLLKPAC